MKRKSKKFVDDNRAAGAGEKQGKVEREDVFDRHVSKIVNRRINVSLYLILYGSTIHIDFK